jgi:hypothetical protein
MKPTILSPGTSAETPTDGAAPSAPTTPGLPSPPVFPTTPGSVQRSDPTASPHTGVPAVRGTVSPTAPSSTASEFGAPGGIWLG